MLPLYNSDHAVKFFISFRSTGVHNLKVIAIALSSTSHVLYNHILRLLFAYFLTDQIPEVLVSLVMMMVTHFIHMQYLNCVSRFSVPVLRSNRE